MPFIPVKSLTRITRQLGYIKKLTNEFWKMYTNLKPDSLSIS